MCACWLFFFFFKFKVNCTLQHYPWIFSTIYLWITSTGFQYSCWQDTKASPIGCSNSCLLMLGFQIFTSAEPQPLQQPPRSVSPGHLWHFYAYRGQPQLQLPGLSPLLCGSHGQVSNSKKQLGYRPEKQTYCKIEISAKDFIYPVKTYCDSDACLHR